MKKQLEIYGTLGPSCCTRDVLASMFEMGMSGVRLNLSHVDLSACEEWIEELHQGAKAAGVTPKLLIDMKGPELRIGTLAKPLTLNEGDFLELDQQIPIPKEVTPYLQKGEMVLLDDGRIQIEVQSNDTAVLGKVIRGGILTSRKSLAMPHQSIWMPTLTNSDIENLKLAKAYGVTGVMQPFVRNAQDLITLQQTLDELDAQALQIYAKIENMDGVEQLEELMPYCDMIVIARGDLGNDMPLYDLPSVQKQIQDRCHTCTKPYMVVTQMLDSMMNHAVPTRAEVSDVFYAVYHGASAIMLTGETAAGQYPLEAMRYFTKTAFSALAQREAEGHGDVW